MTKWEKIGKLLEQSEWVSFDHGKVGLWGCQIRLYKDGGRNQDFKNLIGRGEARTDKYRIEHDIDKDEFKANLYGSIVITGWNSDPLKAVLIAYQAAYPDKKLPWEKDKND
jgi:hypothetical protein